MRSFKNLLTALFSIITLTFLTISPAAAAGNVNTNNLREAVTLEAVRSHQAEFQAIADANGGVRASGTPGYDASTSYVVTQLEAAGYDVILQPFSYPFFQEVLTPVFEQLAPVPTSYPANDLAGFFTMTYSGSGDVTATAEAVDVTIPPGPTANTSTSGCEVSDFAAFTSGNIALIQRGSCTFATKAINAQNAGAVGVIIFNEGQTGRTSAFLGTLGNPVVTIPVIAASFSIGEALYTASPGVTVRISVDAISEIRNSVNIIADLPGKHDRVVVAGAHLDSVPAGPGINDNGSGAAALLEIALQMSAPRFKPRSTVRFAWWGAEETGLVGSSYYVNNLSVDEIKEIGAYLEFEMLGSPNFVRFVYDGDGSHSALPGPDGSESIEHVLNRYFADQGLPVEPAPFDGRHSYLAFFQAGIPTGGLFGGDLGIKTADQASVFGGTAGDQYDPCYHLACDTFDNVNLDFLDQSSDAAAHLIQTFAMTTSSVPKVLRKPPTCEELGYDFGLKVEPEYCIKSSGFWKSNPEAWPVESLVVGGVSYNKDEAIAVMNAKAKGDKTYSLFTETVATMLNLLECDADATIADVVAAANDWLALNPPGSGVKSGDPEWTEGGLLFDELSEFNGASSWSDVFPIDGLGFVSVETEDGIYLNWTSTRSADAVLVKGGRGASVWEYDLESFGDFGLHAPINPKNDTPYSLSYIEFCFDWDIDIDVRKFHDVDGDGEWDADEPEIGIDEFVMPDGTIGGTAGWPYLFTRPTGGGGTSSNIFWTPEHHQHSEAGDYSILEALLFNWEQTALIINGTPQAVEQEAVIPYAGDTDEGYEVVFGNIGYADIRGKKFHDLDADGVRDAAEPGLSGVTIELTGDIDGDGDVDAVSIVTDASGEFSFVGLAPDDYTVTETDWPAGSWIPATPISSGPHSLNAGDSLDLGWVFGNFLTSSIQGYKFNDLDGNGADDAEPRLAGWTIEVWDVSDAPVFLAATVTDDSGIYAFTGIAPGDTWAVCELLADGYEQSFPSAITLPPEGVQLFDCSRLGASYGPYGYQFTPSSGDEFLDNHFGNFQSGPPDLQIRKDDSGVSVGAGGTIIYAIEMENVGPGAATGVMITDTVPVGTTFNASLSSSGWTCADGSPAGTTCEFDISAAIGGEFPGNSELSVIETFAVDVVVPLPDGLTFIVNAVAIGDDGAHGPDVNPGDNFSVAVTPLQFPDLQIRKDDSGVSVGAGGTIIYAIEMENVGPGAATGVMITDTVPVGTTFNASLSSSGWTCADGSPAGTTCEFDISAAIGGEFPGNSELSVIETFAVDVVVPLPDGLTFIVNAVAIGDDGAHGPDVNPGDNFSVAVTPLQFPDLQIRKDDSGVSVGAGGTIIYAIEMENVGPGAATGVMITDTVPVGTTFNASLSSSGWTCADGSPAGTTCEFDISAAIGGEFPGNSELSVIETFAVDVVVPLPDGLAFIVNAVAIGDDGAHGPDVNPGDNFSVAVTPLQFPDLQIRKDDSGVSVGAGGTIIYAIEMENVGPGAATGVMITDTVPVGTTFNASLSSSGWTCADGSPAGTTCEFDISAAIGGEFPGNSELSVIETFAVDVVVPLPDGLTFIVNAVAIGDDGAHGPDVNPGDNFSVAVTPVLEDVNQPPTANPDFYEATGNVGIGKGAGAGLLSNDSDPDLPPQTLTATAETVASANGGSATIAADGSFS